MASSVCTVCGQEMSASDGCMYCIQRSKLPLTTDEMILALVKTGKFTLPDGLSYIGGNRPWRILLTDVGGELSGLAHDLCAMHFARQMDEGVDTPKLDEAEFCKEWDGLMGLGQPEMAIEYLYEALQ